MSHHTVLGGHLRLDQVHVWLPILNRHFKIECISVQLAWNTLSLLSVFWRATPRRPLTTVHGTKAGPVGKSAPEVFSLCILNSIILYTKHLYLKQFSPQNTFVCFRLFFLSFFFLSHSGFSRRIVGVQCCIF